MTAQALDNGVAASRTARPAIIEGIVGSVMVLLGSFGVGWLASVSPLNRNALLIGVRTEAWTVLAAAVVLTLGCFVMVRAWLRLGQRLDGWGPEALRPVRLAIWLWSAPLLLCLPIFSRDVFAYIGQGRLMNAGQNPYADGISTLSNWFQLGADITWAEGETPYGPLFLWIESLVLLVAGESPDLSIALFRLVAFAGVVICAVYVPRLAALHSIDGARALWISVANPLFLISFVASAHNDSLMVGLALAGTFYAATRRPLLGILLVTASIGIKPITLVLLPFIGLLWAGPGAGWGRRIRCWTATLLICGVVMWFIGRVNGFGFGWLMVMVQTGTGIVIFAPLGALAAFIEGAAGSLGIDSSGVVGVLKLVGRLLSVVAVVILILRGKHSHLVQRLALAFSALVLLSPLIQPWYLLWLLPFFAATGIRNDWQLKLVFVTVAFFVAFGAADQIFVWQFLEVEELAKRVSTWVSWACIAYLLFLDPRTKHLMVARWPWERSRTQPPRQGA